MLACGAVRAAGNAAPEARLHAVYAQVEQLVREYAPDVLALESVFAALNVRTALRLAEVRGVVMLAAAQSGIAVHDYSPREVKLSITGYGHAGKHQMQQMVRAQLGLAQAPKPADAADALAVALCHIHRMRAEARLRAATGGAAPPGSDAARQRAGSRIRAMRIRIKR
jgi:crossover junction endodeoxyribonuclease RuvC